MRTGVEVEFVEAIWRRERRHFCLIGERRVRALVLRYRNGGKRGADRFVLEVLESSGNYPPAVGAILRRRSPDVWRRPPVA